MPVSISPCPICGAKAKTYHMKIPEGDFGWDCGCLRFSLFDTIHGITEDTPCEMKPMVYGLGSRMAAITEWNKKAKLIAERMRQDADGA